MNNTKDMHKLQKKILRSGQKWGGREGATTNLSCEASV